MLEAAIITARGGSVGLPGKNIRSLGGVPLIGWTIRAALRSGQFSRIIVSTDDANIAEIALREGAEVPFMRPADLASSQASSADVIRHAIEVLGLSKDFAVLQPTSPFRNAGHLREAASLYAGSSADALVSVVEAKPIEWLRRMNADGRLEVFDTAQKEVHRRQDALPVVCPNGAIYLTSASAFARTGALIPPGSDGFAMTAIHSVDIDDLDDFRLAESIVAAGLCEIDR